MFQRFGFSGPSKRQPRLSFERFLNAEKLLDLLTCGSTLSRSSICSKRGSPVATANIFSSTFLSSTISSFTTRRASSTQPGNVGPERKIIAASKRKNLGTFNRRAAAERHARAVQFVKRRGEPGYLKSDDPVSTKRQAGKSEAHRRKGKVITSLGCSARSSCY